MLVGAPEPWTFLATGMVEEQAALTGTARAMLDLRRGVRPFVFLVFAHVDGPEIDASAKGTTPGTAIQMGSFRAADLATEFVTGAGYARYRLRSAENTSELQSLMRRPYAVLCLK